MPERNKRSSRRDDELSPRSRGKFLRAVAGFQTELFRAEAGFLPAFGDWEIRSQLPGLIYRDARRVQDLRDRCAELGAAGPGKHFSRRAPGFGLIETLCAAADSGAFFRAVFGIVKPGLKGLLEQHLREDLAVFDAPSVPVVEALAGELDRQISWAKGFGEFEAPADGEWLERVRGQCGALGGELAGGGDSGAAVQSAGRRIGSLPILDSTIPGGFREGTADPRLAESDTYADRALYHAHNFFMEVQAADSCASLLFEAPDMPWDFYLDAARHMWDESRHCAFGILKLRDLGRDIREVGVSSIAYATRQTLDPLDRYAALTTQEEDAFPGKHAGLKDSLEHGDAVLARAWSYDISDESQHVRYGRTWIPVMIEECGEPRSYPEIKRDAVNWRRDVLSVRYENARRAFAGEA